MKGLVSLLNESLNYFTDGVDNQVDETEYEVVAPQKAYLLDNFRSETLSENITIHIPVTEKNPTVLERSFILFLLLSEIEFMRKF